MDGEIIRSLGPMLNAKSWLTDEEKLEFLRENGNEMNDEAVQAYAARKSQSERSMFADWKDETQNVIWIYPLDMMIPVQ